MDTLFLLGQVVFLAALVWGAVLCLTSKDGNDEETRDADSRVASRHFESLG
jgi:hypothetical protein